MAGVEALVEGRGIAHPGGLAGGNHGLGVGEGGRHGLFAKDVLAGTGGCLDQGAVEVVRRGDVDRFEAGRDKERIECGVASDF